MRHSESESLPIFKGAGYLFGLAIAMVGAMLVYVLSKNFGAAISAAVPIAVAAGIGFERKFQEGKVVIDLRRTKVLIGLLSLGLLLFVILLFLAGDL